MALLLRAQTFVPPVNESRIAASDHPNASRPVRKGTLKLASKNLSSFIPSTKQVAVRRVTAVCTSVRRTTVLATLSSTGPGVLDKELKNDQDEELHGLQQSYSNGGAATDGSRLPAEEHAKSQELFKWAEAWYPAAMVADLDTDKPTAVTILGRPLVIWWDRIGATWQVFLDECPHRLAPLSEGRIHESGQLQCSYHGWTFGGDGSCGMIPQATNDRAKQSPRACAKVIPRKVQQGMLFVWPDLAEGAAERAAKVSIPSIPEHDDPAFESDFMMREVSYGADTLIENLMDPAHIPVAHHAIYVGGKVQGFRDKAMPLQCKTESISLQGFRGSGPIGPAEFIAPCFWRLDFKFPQMPPKEGEAPKEAPKPKHMVLAFYCVPTTPGNSKIFFTFPSNSEPKLSVMLPRWVHHLGRLTVLDSDMYFLHVMERRIQAKGGVGNWIKACYSPISSDSYVIAYRKWQNTFGGKDFEWGPYVPDTRLPPTPSKEELMDRNKSHVAHCKICQGAKRNFELLQYALGVLSFATLAGLVVAAVTRAEPLPISAALPAALLSGLSALGCERLGKFIYESYVFHDYVHSDVP